jgi:hypothetical protein
MGRTIHYLVEDDGQNHITDAEWQSIEELQEKYNAGHTWTCEQLSLERFSVLPNWTAWKDGLRVGEAWRRIHAELQKPAGMQKLLDNGLIEVSKGGYRGSGYLMSGFTKVAENEFNASLVVSFLQEASRSAPGIRIKVHDEGDYLACPVIIQNGWMAPDKLEIQSQIAYWRQRLDEAPADEMDFWTGLIAKQRQFMELDTPCPDQSVFIAH